MIEINTLILSHYNFGKSGPIHGPVHSITDYLRRSKESYKLVCHPLYQGPSTEIETYDGDKDKLTSKKLSIKSNFSLVIKSFFEMLVNLNIGFGKGYKKIIAIDPLNALSAVILKKFNKNIQVIYYSVDYAKQRFTKPLINNIYHRIDRYVVRESDFNWSVSKRIFDLRKMQGVPEKNNKYVPNSPIYSSIKRYKESKVDRSKIIMVMGKTHNKVLPIVLNAFKEVKKRIPEAKIVLIGPDFKVSEKRGNSVVSMGQVSQEELFRVLKSSGVGLAIYTNDFPWTYYGDSMKAREYCAFGLPVVISDIVSTAEDVEKYKAGKVVKVNSKQIAQAIIEIIKNKNKWISIRKNAINLSKDFDFEKMVSEALGSCNDKQKLDNCVVVTYGKLRGPAHEIRDYLLPKSKKLLFISHPLLFIKDNYSLSSNYVLYKNNKKIKSKSAIHWKGPEYVLYIKDFIYSFVWVWKNFKKVGYFVGSGNINALVGILLKKLGKVEYVVFYCIDYVPYRFNNKKLNNLYHLVDRICATSADETWNLSDRMIQAREKKWKRKFPMQKIVPHGSYVGRGVLSYINVKNYKKYQIVFAGSLLEKQGLQLIIKTIPQIVVKYPKVKLIIIGGGNYREKLEKLTKKMNLEEYVDFKGYLSDSEMKKIIADSHIAIALYNKAIDNFSYYGDPGKVKYYLSLGVPTVLTSVPSIAKDIEEEKCGYVVKYDSKDLLKKISLFFDNSSLTKEYRKNSLSFAKDYIWEKIYEKTI